MKSANFDKVPKPWELSDSDYVKYINHSLSLYAPKCSAKLLSNPENNPRFAIYDTQSGIVRYWQFKLQGLGFGKGLNYVASNIWNSYMLDKIDLRDSDLVYDIGANTGDLELAFLLKGIQPIYVGLEPGISEYKALVANTASEKSSFAINAAIGPDDQESATFYVSSESGDSSLIEPAMYSGTVNVAVRSLSSIHKELFQVTKPIKLVKLEAEGYEPEICEGLYGVLPYIEFISADLGWERGVHSESTAPQVINFLLANGFFVESINKGRLVCLFRNSRQVV